MHRDLAEVTDSWWIEALWGRGFVGNSGTLIAFVFRLLPSQWTFCLHVSRRERGYGPVLPARCMRARRHRQHRHQCVQRKHAHALGSQRSFTFHLTPHCLMWEFIISGRCSERPSVLLSTPALEQKLSQLLSKYRPVLICPFSVRFLEEVICM